MQTLTLRMHIQLNSLPISKQPSITVNKMKCINLYVDRTSLVFYIFFEQVRLSGAADQVRTGPKSLEGSCATTTPQPRRLGHLLPPTATGVQKILGVVKPSAGIAVRWQSVPWVGDDRKDTRLHPLQQHHNRQP